MGISYGALQHPMIALIVAIVLLVVIVFFASMIVRFVRRRFGASVSAGRATWPAAARPATTIEAEPARTRGNLLAKNDAV